MGIEPTPSAWKAEVLPLNYTRGVSPARRMPSSGGLALLSGGGGRITPGVLPFAPSGPASSGSKLFQTVLSNPRVLILPAANYTSN